MTNVGFPSDADLEHLVQLCLKEKKDKVTVSKFMVQAILASLRMNRAQAKMTSDTLEDAKAVPGLVQELNSVKTLNKELGDRLGAVYRELGALEVKAQIQKETIDSYKAAAEHNNSHVSQLSRELDSRRQKFLGFICSECGSPAAAPFDSIDNGTALKCPHCNKESVVSLRRLGEKDGEELHRVAEWAMGVRGKLDDHKRLLEESLKGYGAPGESLRDVVMRLKNAIDILSMGLKGCLGYKGHPHQFLMVEVTRGCPVCDVQSRFS